MAGESHQTLQCGKISVTNFLAHKQCPQIRMRCQGDVIATGMEALHGLQESFLLYRWALFGPSRGPCAHARFLASHTKAHC